MQISIDRNQVESLLTIIARYHKEIVEGEEENKKLKETIAQLRGQNQQEEQIKVTSINEEHDESPKVQKVKGDKQKSSEILFKSQKEKKMINACIRTEKNGYSLYECRICHRIYKSGRQLVIHYEQRHSSQEGYFIRTNKRERKDR